MNDATTLQERYRCAVSSSNLKLSEHRTGEVDILIAAGWSDSLGIKLYRLAGEYDQVAQEMRRMATQTEAILVMSHLKSLLSTRVELVRYALDCAKRWNSPISEQEVGILVGRCLSVFLEANCDRCHGTGRTGGYDGEVSAICNKCRGSGKRANSVGRNDTERLYSHRLLADMDRKMAEADSIMRKYMRAE